jgi:hypothetical protein
MSAEVIVWTVYLAGLAVTWVGAAAYWAKHPGTGGWSRAYPHKTPNGEEVAGGFGVALLWPVWLVVGLVIWVVYKLVSIAAESVSRWVP